MHQVMHTNFRLVLKISVDISVENFFLVLFVPRKSHLFVPLALLFVLHTNNKTE